MIDQARAGNQETKILNEDIQIACYLFGGIAHNRTILKGEADGPFSEIAKIKA